MIWTQIGVAIGLVGMAASNPGLRLQALVIFALITAFSRGHTRHGGGTPGGSRSPTIRRSWTCSPPPYKLGYQIAIILSRHSDSRHGGRDRLAGLVCGFRRPHADRHRIDPVRQGAPRGRTSPSSGGERLRAGASIRMRAVDAVVGPFVSFFGAFGPAALLILLTISAYHLCDYLQGAGDQSVLHRRRVAEDHGDGRAARRRPAPPHSWASPLEGLFAARFGHLAALVVGGILQPFAVAAFALLIYTGPSAPVFSGIMAFDDFSMNFAGVALIIYMSTLTSLGYTATQYALLTSALAWTGKFLKGFSGVWVLAVAREGDSTCCTPTPPSSSSPVWRGYRRLLLGVRPSAGPNRPSLRFSPPADSASVLTS